MKLTDIRSCLQSPGSSLGAALLALFLSATRTFAVPDRLGLRSRRHDGLSDDISAPRIWPSARQIWQH